MTNIVTLICKYEYDKVHETSKNQTSHTKCKYSIVKRDSKKTKKVKDSKKYKKNTKKTKKRLKEKKNQKR